MTSPTALERIDRRARAIEWEARKVVGTCPACRNTTLFLGKGGHVTCSWHQCPDPCAADKRLCKDRHPTIALRLFKGGDLYQAIARCNECRSFALRRNGERPADDAAQWLSRHMAEHHPEASST
jgi:hypothetical protein